MTKGIVVLLYALKCFPLPVIFMQEILKIMSGFKNLKNTVQIDLNYRTGYSRVSCCGMKL
jgi:hypothetical protein